MGLWLLSGYVECSAPLRQITASHCSGLRLQSTFDPAPEDGGGGPLLDELRSALAQDYQVNVEPFRTADARNGKRNGDKDDEYNLHSYE